MVRPIGKSSDELLRMDSGITRSGDELFRMDRGIGKSSDELFRMDDGIEKSSDELFRMDDGITRSGDELFRMDRGIGKSSHWSLVMIRAIVESSDALAPMKRPFEKCCELLRRLTPGQKGRMRTSQTRWEVKRVRAFASRYRAQMIEELPSRLAETDWFLESLPADVSLLAGPAQYQPHGAEWDGSTRVELPLERDLTSGQRKSVESPSAGRTSPAGIRSGAATVA